MVPGMDQPRGQLTRRLALLALVGAAVLGCRPADAAGDREDRRSEASLAQFRAGLAEPKSLSGAAPSRDALVARFVRALETRDTAALVAMHLTRAEFAWLYYPTDPRSRPPYSLPPDLMWFVDHGNSEKGIERLLRDRAGAELGILDYQCDSVTSRQGENTLIGSCVVRRLTAHRDTITERLFGGIIERGGHYKFVSYANKL